MAQFATKLYEVKVNDGIGKRVKVIVRKPHFVTFNERHNACKSKVLIVLYHFKHSSSLGSGLDARGLFLHTGVSYNYLLARLPKWHEWRYVLRHSAIGSNNKPVWHYRIAARGEKFITERLLPLNRPMYERYVREIREFQSIVGQMNPPAWKYRSMKSLIAAVDMEIESNRKSNDDTPDMTD